MTLQFENDGQLAPASRAEVLAATLEYVASLSQPTEFHALFAHLLRRFGVAEEHIGGDIYTALLVLARAGLVVTETYDPIEQSVLFTAGMTIRPNRLVTSYVWAAPEGDDEEGDDD